MQFSMMLVFSVARIYVHEGFAVASEGGNRDRCYVGLVLHVVSAQLWSTFCIFNGR